MKSITCNVCFLTTIGKSAAKVRQVIEIKGYVTATKGEVLAELGFSTDASAGNFAPELHVDELSTRAIAKLIIELLARVYDLGTSDNLEYYAPLCIVEKGQSRYR